jgi:hypothetical protein
MFLKITTQKTYDIYRNKVMFFKVDAVNKRIVLIIIFILFKFNIQNKNCWNFENSKLQKQAHMNNSFEKVTKKGQYNLKYL